MNKAEFMAKPATTQPDKVAQILLRSESMTSLKEMKRVVGGLKKKLYGEDVARVPLADLIAGVEKAAYLIVD